MNMYPSQVSPPRTPGSNEYVPLASIPSKNTRAIMNVYFEVSPQEQREYGTVVYHYGVLQDNQTLYLNAHIKRQTKRKLWLGGGGAWCEGDEEMMVDIKVVTRWWLVWVWRGGVDGDDVAVMVVVAEAWPDGAGGCRKS
ncbi:hypothetical protein Tco_0493295 [Tanacetum coccineum]